MAKMIRTIPELYKMYKEWVCANPQFASEVESSIKWVSYFIAGKVSDSTVMSELVYSVSNLWVLLNDKIILHAHNKFDTLDDARESFKTWLTVLEYSEVFLEISARQMWGEAAKWVVIVVIQFFKCILRLVLLFKYKENILPNPPVPPLQRKKFDEKDPSYDTDSNATEGFTLKSGRTIRTVNSASTGNRNWKPPSSVSPKYEEICGQNLSESQRIGEVLYIIKPLAHLGSMYLHGQRSWQPWFLSLFMDVTSLKLLNSKEDIKRAIWNKNQSVELDRRKLTLLLYLLRSPFYDQYTKQRLNKLLLNMSDSIPLVGLILRPLAKYLPLWQDTHLYLWSA